QGTDENGNPTGTFAAFEEVDSWSFGVNLFETLETLATAGGGAPTGLGRWFEDGFGMNFKRLEMSLGPNAAGSTRAREWGATARVTPIDVPDAAGAAIRLDAAFGVSVLSANDDAVVVFPFENFPVPVSRHHRQGGALHLTIDP